MKARGTALALALAAATNAAAESAAFPKGHSYIVQLTSSQYSSGLGHYLVPPLTRAMNATGLRYEGGPGAEYVATVEHSYDTGSWHQMEGRRVWLYDTAATVGLSPATMDVEPEGRLAPAFSVSARLLTEDADREDEMACLIALAARELAARYRPKGHVTVDGSSCARG